MTTLKFCLAVLVGVSFGAFWFRLPISNASPQDNGTAHVFIFPVKMFDAKNSASQNLPGAKIAGISCIAKPENNLPDAAVCYVATTIP
ncbi:MAG: hypothetical protein WCD49_10145 [Candidatus Acidiferrales bacterium]